MTMINNPVLLLELSPSDLTDFDPLVEGWGFFNVNGGLQFQRCDEAQIGFYNSDPEAALGFLDEIVKGSRKHLVALIQAMEETNYD